MWKEVKVSFLLMLLIYNENCVNAAGTCQERQAELVNKVYEQDDMIDAFTFELTTCNTQLKSPKDELNICKNKVKEEKEEMDKKLKLCKENNPEEEEKVREKQKKIDDLKKILAEKDSSLESSKKDLEEYSQYLLDLGREHEKNIIKEDDKIAKLKESLISERGNVECVKDELGECFENEIELTSDLKEKTESLTKAEEDLLSLEELEEEVRKMRVAKESLETDLNQMSEKSKKCEESCLRKTGEEIIWESSSDEVITKSMTCAGDESELKCQSNKKIEILKSTFGHSKGNTCTPAQIATSDDCGISKKDLITGLNCPKDSTTCQIKIPTCPTTNSINLEIYYKCK